jgi:hypothetical protein
VEVREATQVYGHTQLQSAKLPIDVLWLLLELVADGHCSDGNYPIVATVPKFLNYGPARSQHATPLHFDAIADVAVGKNRSNSSKVDIGLCVFPVALANEGHGKLNAKLHVAAPAGNNLTDGWNRVEADGVFASLDTRLCGVLTVLVRADARLDEENL